MNPIKYPSVSEETKKLYVNGHKSISQIPYDPVDCPCQENVAKYFKRVAEGLYPEYIPCPRKHTGMKQYEIMCSNCGHVVATVWSKDKSMSDFCDLRSICETDGEFWYGAYALNLSPIDGRLGIECSCGQDTRDFRANKTLPQTIKDKIIASNEKGQGFGKTNSKFYLTLMKGTL